MPYITSVERMAIQQGREQMRRVLLESLALGLELKFGDAGIEIVPEVSQIEDVKQLRAIQSGLRTAQIVGELRQTLST